MSANYGTQRLVVGSVRILVVPSTTAPSATRRETCPVAVLLRRVRRGICKALSGFLVCIAMISYMLVRSTHTGLDAAPRVSTRS